MIVYVGSKALQLLGYDVAPKDIDLIGTYESIQEYAEKHDMKTFYPIEEGKKIFMRDKSGMIYEAEVAYPGTLAEEFVGFIKHHKDTTRACDGNLIPSLPVLYLLKLTHRYLRNSPHFLKTMKDVHWFRKEISKIALTSFGWELEFNPFRDWFIRREKETYNYSHPKLNQDKKNFFDTPGINYTYNHDSIHLAVALDVSGIPAYEKFKKDGEEVSTDRKKFFFSLQFEERLNAVVEESCVLALERSLIPFPGTKTPDEAFLMALEKVCTSITSGWFREFAWENYHAAIEHYTMNARNYHEAFQKALTEGKIKPHDPQKGY